MTTREGRRGPAKMQDIPNQRWIEERFDSLRELFGERFDTMQRALSEVRLEVKDDFTELKNDHKALKARVEKLESGDTLRQGSKGMLALLAAFLVTALTLATAAGNVLTNFLGWGRHP